MTMEIGKPGRRAVALDIAGAAAGLLLAGCAGTSGAGASAHPMSGGKEHALFGKEGFEGVVAEVAKLEQAFGIHDLASFTPR